MIKKWKPYMKRHKRYWEMTEEERTEFRNKILQYSQEDNEELSGKFIGEIKEDDHDEEL